MNQYAIEHCIATQLVGCIAVKVEMCITLGPHMHAILTFTTNTLPAHLSAWQKPTMLIASGTTCFLDCTLFGRNINCFTDCDYFRDDANNATYASKSVSMHMSMQCNLVGLAILAALQGCSTQGHMVLQASNAF